MIRRYYREARVLARREFAVSTGWVLLLTALQTLTPLLLRPFMAEVEARRSVAFILLGLASFAVLQLATLLVTVAWMMSLNSFGGAFIAHLTADLQERLGRADLARVQAMGSDRIKHTLFTDVLQIFTVIAVNSSMALGGVAVLVAGSAAAAVYDIGLAGLLLLGVAGGLGISLATRRIIQSSSRQVKGAMMAHNDGLNQFVDGLLMAQTNDVLPFLTRQGRRGVWGFIDVSRRVDAKQVAAKDLVRAYNALFSVGFAAALSLMAGEQFVVNFVFFTALSAILMGAGESLEMAVISMMSSHASFRNVEEIRHLPARHGDAPLDAVSELRLVETAFTYPGADAPTFAPVTRVLRPGDCVRVLAGNGGGKSTLLRLLTGVYTPTRGQVLVNGRPLQDYRQEDVNRAVLVASQDETLLNVTPTEYLEVVAGTSPDEAAGLVRDVGLPGTLPRIVRGGGNLSFGQRKKLLMAKIRARSAAASVVVLDETEAGMDAATRGDFERLVAELASQGRIVVIVTHDASLALPPHETLALAPAPAG